jgi:hypothetical protein
MRLAIAALLALALAAPARADWEGDIKMSGSNHNATGKIRYKSDGRLRFEIAMGPMQMAMIADYKNQKSITINDNAKTYSEQPMGHGRSMGPDFTSMVHCKALEFEGCMKEMGMKKVGTGEANGQACTIWEGEQKARGPMMGESTQRLWHPDAAGNEFAMVRGVTKFKSGKENQFDVENWKQADQDESLFAPPEGYTKNDSPFGGMMGPPNMKGFKPKHGGPTGGEMKEKDGE